MRITEGESAEEFEIWGAASRPCEPRRRRYAAGAVCITSGSWSRPLLARLGVTIPLKPIRGQIALLQAKPNLLRRVINEGKHYLVPRADGRVLVGSTEEDVGFLKLTTAAAIGDLLSFARELVPALATRRVGNFLGGAPAGNARRTSLPGAPARL